MRARREHLSLCPRGRRNRDQSRAGLGAAEAAGARVISCGGSSWVKIICGQGGVVKSLFWAASRAMSPACGPGALTAPSRGCRQHRPKAAEAGEARPKAAGKGEKRGGAARETAANEPVGLGRFKHIFSLGPSSSELSRSPGLLRGRPTPGVLREAGPSAPPGGEAFGGPRSSPRERCRGARDGGADWLRDASLGPAPPSRAPGY